MEKLKFPISNTPTIKKIKSSILFIENSIKFILGCVSVVVEFE